MAEDTFNSIQAREVKAVKFGMHDTDAQAQTSHADQAAAPAGGVGADAGAYDTSANRDKFINLLNAIRTTLVDNGIMKGSA